MGSLHVEGTDWRPAKALVLLAYLSIQGPTSRRRLRELFWPQAQDPGASLRVLLRHLRNHLPGAVQGEETVEVLIGSDAAALLRLDQTAGSAPDTALYTGPFLAGARLSEISTELGEWVLETRERLAGAARLAAIRAAETAGSPTEAVQWAERAAALVEAPPLEGSELERLLRLVAPGSLLEAELRREQAEFGETGAPADRHQAEQELLGRERELGFLLLALTDPAVRLLEITGSGGIGKSTLAAALLREQADLSGVQVLSIALETALASSEAAARMVVALKLQVTDRGDGWLALADACAERSLLVLLDGAEGLPDLGRGIATLLARCPNIRVVVTSRIQRLTLGAAGLQQGATHLALDGLSVPGAGELPERVARSAAVQLFARGARRYLPRFALDAQNAPQVSAIVRRLGGHPLATVLCATWMRIYPPAQIHTLVLQDLSALRAETGSSERHHLSAVFERSWLLLTQVEAQAIAALAVFQGFDPAAALAVANVSEALLDQLKTHSLVREVQQDSRKRRRLEVPPVLAAQAQAHLENAAAVLDAHAEYYLYHLMAHAPESDEVNDERANIVAAVGYAVGRGRNVSTQIDTLLLSYDRRGLLDSGTDALYTLREALPDENTETGGSILIGLAWMLRLSSHYLEAEELCIHILHNFESRDSVTRMKANNIIANSLIQKGKNLEALDYLSNALKIAKIRSDRNREVMYSLNISEIYINTGRYKEAIDFIVNRINDVNDQHLNLLVREQILRSRYYIDNLDEANKEEVEGFLRDFTAVSMSRPYMLVTLTYSRILVKLGKYRQASAVLRSLLKHTEGGGIWDIGIAAQIIEVEIDYAVGKPNIARSKIANIMKSKFLINDSRAIYEIILACSENIFSIDPEFTTSALLTIIHNTTGTQFQIETAKLKLKGNIGKESSVLLSNSNLIEWITKFAF